MPRNCANNEQTNVRLSFLFTGNKTNPLILDLIFGNCSRNKHARMPLVHFIMLDTFSIFKKPATGKIVSTHTTLFIVFERTQSFMHFTLAFFMKTGRCYIGHISHKTAVFNVSCTTKFMLHVQCRFNEKCVQKDG